MLMGHKVIERNANMARLHSNRCDRRVVPHPVVDPPAVERQNQCLVKDAAAAELSVGGIQTHNRR